MYIVPFKKEHFDFFLEKGITDKKLEVVISPSHGKQIESHSDTYTLLNDFDEPVVIGGIRQFWFNRGEAWLLFSSQIVKKDVLRLHKIVKSFLNLTPYKRVEIVVDSDNESGHRLAKIYGFKKEGLMRAYRSDGGDTVLYAKVRE